MPPDYGRLHREPRCKGVTLMLLRAEHRADYANSQTCAYSQFCENYRQFTKQLKRSMCQVPRAAENLFIDYAGPTIALADGGRAHFFVASKAASSYTYACATPRETMANWLESTARALRSYCGVTQLIVPDNPRTRISDANRYAPRSNDTLLDVARHHGTLILPIGADGIGARRAHCPCRTIADASERARLRLPIVARFRHKKNGKSP